MSCKAKRGEEGHVWYGEQLEVWSALLHIGKGGRVYCRVLGGGRPNNPLSQIDCTETLRYKEKQQLKSQRSVKDGFDRKIRGEMSISVNWREGFHVIPFSAFGRV